jgi:hypothetical protein
MSRLEKRGRTNNRIYGLSKNQILSCALPAGHCPGMPRSTGEMKAILLVTWIVSGQPPNSYQSPFGSMEGCQAARTAVIAEGSRLNTEWEQNAARVFGLINKSVAELVRIGYTLDQALGLARQEYQVYLVPRPQSSVSAICVAQ